MKNLVLLILAGLTFSHPLQAIEPGQYGPGDNSGHGVFVNCNASDECAVFWFNHLSEDEQVWLMGVPNCKRGPEPCDVSLTVPSAPVFSGRPGEVEIGPSVGTLELTPMADGTLTADWNVIALRQEACLGITPGGLILRKCVGVQVWTKIAGQ